MEVEVILSHDSSEDPRQYNEDEKTLSKQLNVSSKIEIVVKKLAKPSKFQFTTIRLGPGETVETRRNHGIYSSIISCVLRKRRM